MQRSTSTSDERGQAYTLEGFVSAMIVLMALLFALQSVVITPSTDGVGDRTVQAQLEQEAQDALLVAATEDDGNLTEMVRYWDPAEEEFHNSSENSGTGYYKASNDTELYNEFALGKTLNERFTERGMSYNIELVSQDQAGEFDDDRPYLVYQGESEAVTASYTVTLFESDNLTAPGHEDTPIREAWEDHEYPIPPSTDEDQPVYNVVEVRVSVW